MAIDPAFELATSALFREVSNFITPPKAGKITAIEGSGQVRVDTDDPDGGDVLAWPLNGFTYAVDDVIYVAFAVNSPDSAIVLGSKGTATTPTLSAYIRRSGVDTLTGDWDIGEDRRILAEALRARDNEGLRLEDDAGNLGVFIEDGGQVGVRTAAPDGNLHGYAVNFADSVIFERGGQTADDFFASMRLLTTKTTNMGDGFGPAFTLAIRDDAGVISYVGAIGAVRNGADNTGRIVLAPIIAGTTTPMASITGTGLGVKVTQPQGMFHAHDGTGGWLEVTKSSIGATAVEIIPNGTGDVIYGLMADFVVRDSGGGVYGGRTTGAIAPGGNEDLITGINALNLRVNANGSVDIRRTAGSLTFTVNLILQWL